MRAETRARIEAVICRLEYRPNNAARQLKTGRAPLIGILVPSVANPFFGELAVALEQAAQRWGFRAVLCNTLRDLAREHDFAAELTAHGMRGLITASALTDPVQIRRLLDQDVSVVAIDARRADVGIGRIDVVTMDNAAAAAVGVSHLAGLGHRRIAYVTGLGRTFNREGRLRGFREAMEQHGLQADIVIVGEAETAAGFGDGDLAGVGRKAATTLLRKRTRPTAVLAFNDMTAIGLAAGLREAGVSVPGEMSLVGIDDIAFARLIHPALTTVRQPVEQMASAALSCLVARLEGDRGPGTETVFPPELVVRGSTAELSGSVQFSTIL